MVNIHEEQQKAQEQIAAVLVGYVEKLNECIKSFPAKDVDVSLVISAIVHRTGQSVERVILTDVRLGTSIEL